MKNFEWRLFPPLHLEVIIGSCHSLERANNTRNWTKTTLNDCIEKVSGVMFQVLSPKTSEVTLFETNFMQFNISKQTRV